MVSLDQLTGPSDNYVPVPAAGSGICSICHGPAANQATVCETCTSIIGQVSHPIRLVVPISLLTVDTQLYWQLANYKGPVLADMGPSYPDEYLMRRLGALLSRFLGQHDPCIQQAAEPWDFVTTVPSSCNRPGTHPLRLVITRYSTLASDEQNLLRPGPASLEGPRADDRGFVADGPLHGMRIVLIDDILASGARLQSAASALAIAGAKVVAAVVVGRLLNLDDPTAKHLWHQIRIQPFTFDTCCLESRAQSR